MSSINKIHNALDVFKKAKNSLSKAISYALAETQKKKEERTIIDSDIYLLETTCAKAKDILSKIETLTID